MSRPTGPRDKALAADIIFTPPEASALAVKVARERSERPEAGVPLYVPGLDDYFNKMRAGDLVIVMGRPSNYKTGTMMHTARHEAITLARAGRRDEFVAYVTWEQSVEQMTLGEIAAASGESMTDLIQGRIDNPKRMMQVALRRGSLPLWIIGHSNERRRRRPRLSLTDVGNALTYVEDEWGRRPSLIVLDYLQRIRSERGAFEMRMHMMDCVDRAKDMALAMGCPVILGCQARREVDSRLMKMPTMADGQESSNIEQTADGILCVWMPKVTETLDEQLPVAPPGWSRSQDLPNVTGNLLLINVAKQKFGPAGRTFALYVEPERNKIGLMAPDYVSSQANPLRQNVSAINL